MSTALKSKQVVSAKALAATDDAVKSIKAKWQQGLDEAAKVHGFHLCASKQLTTMYLGLIHNFNGTNLLMMVLRWGRCLCRGNKHTCCIACCHHLHITVSMHLQNRF